MSKTLCENCRYGLVRVYDCGDENCKETHFNNKCLLGMDYPGTVITQCNCYKKVKGKVTYHDPDFGEFEKKLLAGDILRPRG